MGFALWLLDIINFSVFELFGFGFDAVWIGVGMDPLHF